jgi:SAM-dependent methyltransferase
MLYLNPLLLQAYKGVDFRPWLRGSLAGITPADARHVLTGRDVFRRGVLTNVAIHARLERKHDESSRDVKTELKRAGFKKELIVANVRRLEKLVRRLEWKPGASEWSDYGATTSYDAADAARKEEFVREVVHTREWNRVWDIGCNEGRHSRIAAENSRYVVALDGDAAVVDRLYRSLASAGEERILPLAVDVTDPSPALGWHGLERQTLDVRGKPELTLCLAVLHHVVMSGNVPVAEFLSWLRELGTALVIEFPTRDDPRVAALLQRKKEGAHPDYDREAFERELADRFDIVRTVELASGTRILHHANPR